MGPPQNSGDGYAYIYANVGFGEPNSTEGVAYTYENVGFGEPNSGEGAAYAYENVLLYVVSGSDKLPPTIN